MRIDQERDRRIQGEERTEKDGAERVECHGERTKLSLDSTEHWEQ